MYQWRNFWMLSKTETIIAQALEDMGIGFAPNIRFRLTKDGERCTHEVDFLVVHGGRVGILEVDGEPYHPAERSAIEHRRDRAFKHVGIHTVERFDASECFETPIAVVEEFLEILGGGAFNA